MNRLLIIDGHNLHFQVFFGIRAKQKKKPGYPVKFVESFTGSLIRIIRAASATHVLVVFDGEHDNPRRALFPAYKANRPDYSLLPDEENPYLKLPEAFEALEKLGVKYIETTTVEADDLIAICCERFRSAAQITICSHDHDFYQLLGSRVNIMNYSGKRGEFYGEADFSEEFHIPAKRFADYKALVGDKSDNIPGVRGVGNIVAARLLRRFGGIEEIIARTGEVRQKKLRHCLIEGADRMRLNYKLVKLGGEQYGEVKLPWKLADLAFTLPERKKNGNTSQNGKAGNQNPRGQNRRRSRRPQDKKPVQTPIQTQVQTPENPELLNGKPINTQIDQVKPEIKKPIEAPKEAQEKKLKSDQPRKNQKNRRRPKNTNQPRPDKQINVPEAAKSENKNEDHPETAKDTRKERQNDSRRRDSENPRRNDRNKRQHHDESSSGQSGDRINTRKPMWMND